MTAISWINVVNRIMAFEGDGRLVQYEGGYTDYLEAKERKGTVSGNAFRYEWRYSTGRNS